MAPLNKFVLASLCVLAVNPVMGAPIASSSLSQRQIAGFGSACNSMFSQTDNGSGYAIEDAEDNTGSKAAGTKNSVPTRRQLAGVGAGCDSILSQTDNGVGYGVEDIEDNTGNTIKSGVISTGTMSSGGNTGPPPPPPGLKKRQSPTNAPSRLGAPPPPKRQSPEGAPSRLGAPPPPKRQSPEGAPSRLGAPPPPAPERRQLNKISDGFGTLTGDIGAGAVGQPIDSIGNTIDTEGTDGAANIGNDIGNAEAGTLEGIGSAIP